MVRVWGARQLAVEELRDRAGPGLHGSSAPALEFSGTNANRGVAVLGVMAEVA